MNNKEKARPESPAMNTSKDKKLALQSIRNQIEKATGNTLSELKHTYTENKLFFIGLKYVTTSKKAICEALNIPIEAGCRYKRKYEKTGTLVESIDQKQCPYTHHSAHLISTNPDEFERLQSPKVKQLSLFDAINKVTGGIKND